jgi:hypothetical protein
MPRSGNYLGSGQRVNSQDFLKIRDTQPGSDDAFELTRGDFNPQVPLIYRTSDAPVIGQDITARLQPPASK